MRGRLGRGGGVRLSVVEAGAFSSVVVVVRLRVGGAANVGLTAQIDYPGVVLPHFFPPP